MLIVSNGDNLHEMSNPVFWNEAVNFGTHNIQKKKKKKKKEIPVVFGLTHFSLETLKG